MDDITNKEAQSVDDIEITKVENKQDVEISNAENETDVFDPMPNMSFNRKFRRMLLKQSGYVKHKNKLKFKDWFENLENNIKNGRQLHTLNTEENIKRSREFYEKVNVSTAEFLVQKGYSEEDVAGIIQKNMDIQERIQLKKIKK